MVLLKQQQFTEKKKKIKDVHLHLNSCKISAKKTLSDIRRHLLKQGTANGTANGTPTPVTCKYRRAGVFIHKLNVVNNKIQ